MKLKLSPHDALELVHRDPTILSTPAKLLELFQRLADDQFELGREHQVRTGERIDRR